MKKIINHQRRTVSLGNLFKQLLITNLLLADCAWPAAPQFYESRDAFLAGLAGSQVLTQDFNGFAVNANMSGATVLPGVTVSSSFGTLTIWNDHTLFGYDGYTRNLGNGRYDLSLTNYNAVGFDIMAWNPAPGGAARAVIHLHDGSIFQVERRQTGESESTPVFFGVIADQPVVRIEWHESPETYGGGNEEVSLDNLLCAATTTNFPPSLSGTWEPDAYTGHAARLVIWQTGADWFIHGYGACGGDFCDLGAVPLLQVSPYNDGAFAGWFAIWNFDFKMTYLWLRLDGQALVVESIDVFHDFSGRTPYSVLSRMHKVGSETVSVTTTRNPKAGTMTLQIPTDNQLILQKCTDLKTAKWVDVPLPSGATEHELPTTGEQGFFRLIKR